MAFTAESIAPIEFDLTGVGGPAGKVPEPGRDQVETFRRAVQRATVHFGVDGPLSGAPLNKALKLRGLSTSGTAKEKRERLDAFQAEIRADAAKIPERLAEKLNHELLEAIVAVCQGSPTLDQLKALPPRHQTGFFRYLVNELFDPSEGSPGIRADA